MRGVDILPYLMIRLALEKAIDPVEAWLESPSLVLLSEVEAQFQVYDLCFKADK